MALLSAYTVPPVRMARSSRTKAWWLLAGSAAAVAALAVVAWAAFDVSRLQHLDARVLARLSAHRGGPFGDLASIVADLGDPAPQVLLLAAGVVVALLSGRRRAALAGVVLVLGADLTTAVLKHLLAAPRFDPVLGWEQATADAFPSGHATAAFSAAAAWALFVPPLWRRLTALIGLLAASGVAVSVVVLHYHLPSDVLGGILVAAAWTFAMLAVLQLCSFAQEDEPRSATFEA
jgi:membrane-associated phospholipid phosphatase